jgi:hypothetical protein
MKECEEMGFGRWEKEEICVKGYGSGGKEEEDGDDDLRQAPPEIHHE